MHLQKKIKYLQKYSQILYNSMDYMIEYKTPKKSKMKNQYNFGLT